MLQAAKTAYLTCCVFKLFDKSLKIYLSSIYMVFESMLLSVIYRSSFRSLNWMKIVMNKLLIVVLAMVMLAGCDTVDDMKGMFEKQKLAQTAIKEKYGWDSQLGFNINNGKLTQVTVVLSAREVRGETVENLENMAKEVVGEVFKSQPQAIYIQIASIPDSDS